MAHPRAKLTVAGRRRPPRARRPQPPPADRHSPSPHGGTFTVAHFSAFCQAVIEQFRREQRARWMRHDRENGLGGPD
jgi:hypothetical protein